MCGIVAYLGRRQAAPLLLDGVERLEYRGYDSAGIALVNHGITVYKTPGKIAALRAQLDGKQLSGTVGMAHTRWATHGAPTQENAHPHTDASDRFAVIHNGIIENANAIRKALTGRGYVFRSETDTEVLVALIAAHYDGSLEDAVAQTLREVEGAYGIAVLCADEPQCLVVARNGSPLLLGIGDGEYFAASDASAIVEHTRSVVYLDDQEMAVLTPAGYRVLGLDTQRISKPINVIDWDLETIERGGFAHFMLKEIMEQPTSVENTFRGRLLQEEGAARLGGLNLTDADLLQLRRIVLTACGTSWHAALIGEYMLEEFGQIAAEVEYASEFRYRNPYVDGDTLVIGISQSGETADTLAALREAKRRGARTLGLVNVVGSTIAREVDGGVYLHAGPEIGVASTKAFTSQVMALVLLTLRLGRLRGGLSILQGREIVEAINRIPKQIERVIQHSASVESVARQFAESPNALYLGRGYNFPVALEGALKLKEISYIHAEGYPAAEMKHGPIALIDEFMPVIFLAPRDPVYEKILSNMAEVRARGGRIVAVVTEGDTEASELADSTIEIPDTIPLLVPLLAVLPLQLLAYYIAVHRGCDVDQPRNLAKSVTVE